MKEKQRRTASGFAYLVVLLAVLFAASWQFIEAIGAVAARQESTLYIPGGLFVIVCILLCFKGLFGVQPNQGVVLQLFGHYVGTERTAGLRWANPFYSKRNVSLR